MADRRSNLLRGAILAAAVTLGGCVLTPEPAPSTTVTTSGDVAPVTTTSAPTTTLATEGATVLSGEETFPDGFTVPPGEVWRFAPDADTTVTVSGNVEVLGTLEMQPAPDVEHVLRFENVDESAFVGGSMDPVESDVGLWVVGDGQLALEGTPKTAWGYEYDPEWEGDEVVAAPNSPGDYDGFEEVTATPDPNALGYPTELLNLTRNVRIEGTPDGYTHVFIRSTQPQTIRYAALRYMAPGFSDTDQTGRYGLHIHRSEDGSRGSLIEGVVIRDTANHAFVPHASHGMTFRDTIAFDVQNEAYWWDPPGTDDDDDEEFTANDTNDLVWDRAVAARVDLGAGGSQFRLGAFFLGNGANVTLTNSVAVGVQGESGSARAGFTWPEAAGAPWTFENNIAHNNEANGIFVWQNTDVRHDVERFTAYYNHEAGVEHGAYGNSYQYSELTLLENGSAIRSHALGEASEGADTQTWTDLTTEGGTLIADEHQRPGEAPVRFVGCDFGEVLVIDGEGEEPGMYDFVDCGLEPEDFVLEDADPASRFRVQREDGSAYELSGDGTVTDISSFYPG